MADEYTPTDDDVRDAFCGAETAPMLSSDEYGKAFDRWLAAHDARVARDAAREALDGFERKCDEIADRFRADAPGINVRQRERAAEFATIYRDTHYPETEG